MERWVNPASFSPTGPGEGRPAREKHVAARHTWEDGSPQALPGRRLGLRMETPPLMPSLPRGRRGTHHLSVIARPQGLRRLLHTGTPSPDAVPGARWSAGGFPITLLQDGFTGLDFLHKPISHKGTVTGVNQRRPGPPCEQGDILVPPAKRRQPTNLHREFKCRRHGHQKVQVHVLRADLPHTSGKRSECVTR